MWTIILQMDLLCEVAFTEMNVIGFDTKGGFPCDCLFKAKGLKTNVRKLGCLLRVMYPSLVNSEEGMTLSYHMVQDNDTCVYVTAKHSLFKRYPPTFPLDIIHLPTCRWNYFVKSIPVVVATSVHI